VNKTAPQRQTARRIEALPGFLRGFFTKGGFSGENRKTVVQSAEKLLEDLARWQASEAGRRKEKPRMTIAVSFTRAPD